MQKATHNVNLRLPSDLLAYLEQYQLGELDRRIRERLAV